MELQSIVIKMARIISDGILALLMLMTGIGGDTETCHFKKGQSQDAGMPHGGRSLLQEEFCICSGHGRCSFLSSNQTLCMCEVGFGGPDCSLECPYGFTGYDCSVVLDCNIHGGCSGHGVCVAGGECLCDPAWSGLNCSQPRCPRKCSGHGSCNEAGICVCDQGWKGRACGERACVSNCSQNGLCVMGVCECFQGFDGEFCEIVVCPGGCSGHGECDRSTQRCQCSPWYIGEDCLTPVCPGACSGHGDCLEGVCSCDWNWTGADCAIRRCPMDCSGHGTCQQIPSNHGFESACFCESGYSGVSCSLLRCMNDCSENGLCVNGTCVCKDGWVGSACELDSSQVVVTGLCPYNCSYRGTCRDGKCDCDNGWSGPSCMLPLSSCPDDCSLRGSCVNGTCLCDSGWTGLSCSVAEVDNGCSGNCPNGSAVMMNGSCVCLLGVQASSAVGKACPMNCSGHGTCLNGLCVCDTKFSGLACENMLFQRDARSLCRNNCSGHGSCVNESCLCQDGWGSVDCSFSGFVDLHCPANCTSRGICANGTCICDAGFSGEDCSRINLRGQSSGCKYNCSGHGTCMNTTCNCDFGYTGMWCQSYDHQAIATHPSSSIQTLVKPLSACPGNGCSGHGFCINSTCVCDPFYSGKACQNLIIQAMVLCPRDCSGHGTCLNGTCICDVDWISSDCSIWSTCDGYLPQANTSCSGHGLCLNGTCVCQSFWTGSDCGVSSCSSDCSGHGACLNGTCACQQGWTGLHCSELSCPGDCSGHGSCVLESKQSTACMCDDGWTGADCSVRLCPTSVAGIACSGNGGCTQNGTCICYAKWKGYDCSQLIDCSSRGTRICGYCVCEDGFSGADCEIDICADSRMYDPAFPDNHTKSTVCSGRGKCTTQSGCVCNQGWAGRNCSNVAVCPNSCSGHGKCFGGRDTVGECNCDRMQIPGSPFSTLLYTGGDCSIRHCPGWVEGSPGVECSGRGACQVTNGIYSCVCFKSQASSKPYTGVACTRPPQFFLQQAIPAVGPLEGGTVVTLFGAGIELILSEQLNQIYCAFGGLLGSAVSVGLVRDSIRCTSPPTAIAGFTNISLVDSTKRPLSDLLTGEPSVSNALQFEYFAQTQIIRITPTFAPLRPTGSRRWIGPWDAYGPNKDGSNVISVTGSYFPSNGNYACMFGNCPSPKVTWVNEATLTCVMPTMAEASALNIYVSSNSQQFSNTESQASLFKAYAVTAITPLCGSILGMGVLTVFGKYLVDPSDHTRDESAQFCRFGRTSSTGQTSTSAPERKVLAFYSAAKASSVFPGALECAFPDWPVEEDDFALSLNARCGVGQCSKTQLDGYYIGQWDALDALSSEQSYNLTDEGIPRGIKYSTFYPPTITRLSDKILVVDPSIGPFTGGTSVTITGLGFNYARYGPDTFNSIFEAWTPAQLLFDSGNPRCSVLSSPAYQVSRSDYMSSPANCMFGSDVTKSVSFVSIPDGGIGVVCVAPSTLQSIDEPMDVTVEVALDGQSYTSDGFLFQYVPLSSVTKVIPSAGVTDGGTKITVQGKNFFESSTLSNKGSRAVLSCVFIIPLTAQRVQVDATLQACEDSPDAACTAVVCVTPAVSQEQVVTVDVSMSGQVDDSQLSGSNVAFVMYSNPVISRVSPAKGTTNIGTDSDRVVNIFFQNSLTVDNLNLKDLASTMMCKFGSYFPVQATLKSQIDPASGVKLVDYLTCVAPKVNLAQVVNLNITLNGVDWSRTPVSYTFVGVSAPLMPSSGPIRGGTTVSVNISTGNVGAPVSGCFATDSLTCDALAISSKVLGGTGLTQFLSPPTLNKGKSRMFVKFDPAGIWYDIGLTFFYYDSNGLVSSILPCSNAPGLNLNNPDCHSLYLPKDDLNHPVSFYLDTSSYSANERNELVSSLINADLQCSYWVSGDTTKSKQFCAKAVFKSALLLVSCIAPQVPAMSALERYNVSLKLNGQNVIEDVFELIYLPPPTINSIRPSSGAVSGGMIVTLSGSNWTDSQGRLPSLLSCLVYDCSSNEMHFVPTMNTLCQSTGECTTTCTAPAMGGSRSGCSLGVQFYLSLNRRDPCIPEDCKSKCSEGDCVCVNDLAANFNQSTQGWCSAPYISNKCDLKCQNGKAYEVYQDPVLTGLSPTAVINRYSNMSVSLYGKFPTCTTKANIIVQLSYLDGQSSMSYALAVDSVSASNMSLILAFPCVEPSNPASCQRNNGLDRNFIQMNDIMKIQFQISMNGGGQYTTDTVTMEVYKTNETIICARNCGHGTCLSVKDKTLKLLNYCLCGYWEGTRISVCGAGNASNDACTCASNPSCPQRCAAPSRGSTLYSVQDYWYCSSQTSSIGSSFSFGPEFWPYPEMNRPNELSCAAGPRVERFSPSVGTFTGGTIIVISVTTLNGFSNSDITTIMQNSNNIGCYFDQASAANTVIVPQGLSSYILHCTTPSFANSYDITSDNPLSINLDITFRNSAGFRSPYKFPFGVAAKYLFAKTPTVEKVWMEICRDAGRADCKLHAIHSVPVCVGDCEASQGALVGMSIIIEGQFFQQVDLLSCCFTKGSICNQTDALITAGEYLSFQRVRCPISISPAAAGRYRAAVSLNRQEYSDLSQSPTIIFFIPPLGVDGEVTDQQGTKVQLTYGVDSVFEEKMMFLKRGPSKGQTPISVHFAEYCSGTSCSDTLGAYAIPLLQQNLTLRFVRCSENLLECTCLLGLDSYDAPAMLLEANGESYSILNVTNRVFLLRAFTPNVSASGAGTYLMCFAVNGVHFLPVVKIGLTERFFNYRIATARPQPFSYQFYDLPLLSRIIPASGPFVTSDADAYAVQVVGENFLDRTFPTFVYLCPGGFGQFCASKYEVIGVNPINSSLIEVKMPKGIDLSTPVFNLTISYNNFDFTPFGRSMTEFKFYQTPRFTSITPAWGLYGRQAVITILGSGFENLPLQSFCIFSRCVIENDNCTGGQDPRIFRATTTYISSTAISCTTPTKPPSFQGDQTRMMSMYVTYTPDGRDTTRYAPGMSELWGQISLLGGRTFSYTDDLSNILQTSSRNLPLTGGTISIKVIDQFWCPISTPSCRSCLTINSIDTLVVSLVPTSSQLRSRFIGIQGNVLQGNVTSKELEIIPDLQSPFPKLGQSCRVTVNVTFGSIPFPMTVDLKFSFDNGQHFTDLPKSILIFRGTEPTSTFPLRASRSFAVRPTLNIYFSNELLRTSGPSILPSTVMFAFGPASSNCQYYCDMGPKCRFDLMSWSNVTSAIFVYDETSPYLYCTVPSYPVNGTVQVYVSFDGRSYFTSSKSTIYMYEEPFVNEVYPTIGYWDARTQLLILGNGFLDYGPSQQTWQTWCVFDFQDVLPPSDQWNIPRRWTKALPFCETPACDQIRMMTCPAPSIPLTQIPLLPRYPRARLGLIVDGFCTSYDQNGDCLALMNANGRGNLASDAFFVYADKPTISTVVPQAASPQEDLMVTITGTGFVDQYNWGPSARTDGSRDTVFSRKRTQKLCLDPPSSCASSTKRIPCPALTCRFGQLCTCSDGRCVDIVSNTSAFFDSANPNTVICKVPSIRTDNLTAVKFNLSVSLNGQSGEYSVPVPFIYVATKVRYIYPTFGSSLGGGVVSVYGDNFQNVSCGGVNGLACLHCRFQQSSLSNGLASTQLVPALFVNSTLITCIVPSASTFGVAWKDSIYGKLPGTCGDDCKIKVSVSVNRNTYVSSSSVDTYLYKDGVTFTNIGANSSVMTGKAAIKVYASNLDVSTQIQCSFGSTIVQASVTVATVRDGYAECTAPAMTSPGQVQIGFSINSADFCYLLPSIAKRHCVRFAVRQVGPDGMVIPQSSTWPIENQCQCQPSYAFTAAELARAQKFVYHEQVQLQSISPPSGTTSGGTTIILTGIGFTDYGQMFYVYFGPATSSDLLDHRVAVPATIVNGSTMTCRSPARPLDQIRDSQSPPTTYYVFIPDVATPIAVSSNGIQFSDVQDGTACPSSQTNVVQRDNPKAQCALNFVMFTWFLQPVIRTLTPIPDVNIYRQLASAAPGMYTSLEDLTEKLPQGPTTGGTVITLTGDNFISMARAEVINGQGTSVVCPNDVLVNGAVLPGKSCTTTCVFPFSSSITPSGAKLTSPPYPYNYQCVNLKFTVTQTASPQYWCDVQDTAPASFSGKYGYCRNDITIWRDYNQGGKVITNLECRFGEIHVPATIVPSSSSSDMPQMGRSITCVTPPFPYGTIVPVSVTLNRKDYSPLTATTYFQYLRPAPMPVSVRIDSMVTSFTISFDAETNMGGQTQGATVFCAPLKLFPDGDGSSDNFVGPQNKFFATPPRCTWLDRSNLNVEIGVDFSLENGTQIPLKEIACDAPTGLCWHWNYFQDLRSSDQSQRSTDVLVSESTVMGCRYPRHPSLPGPQQCSSTVLQSDQDRWCGACIPTNAAINELSLPLNRSISTLVFAITPQDVTRPVPVIRGPSSVDTCLRRCYEDSSNGKVCKADFECPGSKCYKSIVQLDATSSLGSLGKNFRRISWSFSPGTAPVVYPSITTFDNGQISDRNLEYKFLNPIFFQDINAIAPNSGYSSQYCFFLTLGNWLGGVSTISQCFPVTVSGNIPVPQISLLQGALMQSARVSEDLIIAANVTPSACIGSNTNYVLKYMWTISPSVSNWFSSGNVLDQAYLSIKAYSVKFVFGIDYRITLNATMTSPSFGTTSSTQTVVKRFTASAPVIRFDGGSYQTFSQGYDPLNLDASKSFDPDVSKETRSPQDLTFCWSCKTASGSNCGWQTVQNVSIELVNTSNLIVPSRFLGPDATYFITISAAKRSNQSCPLVSGSSAPVSAQNITVRSLAGGPLASIMQPASTKILPSSALRLRGYVLCGPAAEQQQACPCPFAWSIVPQVVDPATNLIGSSGSACGVVDFMALAGAFPANTRGPYTIQLSTVNGGMTASSWIKFDIVSPPRSGIFQISPSTGVAFQTIFNLSCASWVDELEDLPMLYKFSIISTGLSAEVPLSVWSEINTLFTMLPAGDSSSNYGLTIAATIANSNGASAQPVQQTVKCTPLPISTSSQQTAAMTALKNSLNALIQQPYVTPMILGQMNVLSLFLNQMTLVAASTSDILQLQQMRENAIKLISGTVKSTRRRNLLALANCTSVYNQNTIILGASNLNLLTDVPQSFLTITACSTSVEAVKCYLSTGNNLGPSISEADQTAAQLFGTVSNCMNLTDTLQSVSTARILSIMSWKDKSSADHIMILRSKGWMTITFRTLASDTSDRYIAEQGMFNATVPGNLGLSGSNPVDYYVFAANSALNPFIPLSSQQVMSPTVDISVRNGYVADGQASPTSIASDVWSLTDIQLNSLSRPVMLEITIDSKPPLGYESATGIFNASVCSYLNATTTTWQPYDTGFVASCEPNNCPETFKTETKKTSVLNCRANFLGTFSTISSTVGCDFVASVSPKAYDTCCLCSGEGENCCDYRRIITANNPIPSSHRCSFDENSKLIMDKCLVCNGKGAKFTGLDLLNVSGICDWQGHPCLDGTVPNACGVCDDPLSQNNRRPSSGLCDCDPVFPRLPQEIGGGKLVDRCQICNGLNASMDDCGSNGDVPAYSNESIYFVCHSGGRSASPNWNKACTGCDNVTRPDLPFVASRTPFPGGVQLDRCGVCGGDNTTCAGCDGVPGSLAQRDFCGECGGRNTSCIGCDGAIKPRPTQNDSCYDCGGDFFGACRVTYTHAFEQTVVLKLSMTEFLTLHQQVFKNAVRLVAGRIISSRGVDNSGDIKINISRVTAQDDNIEVLYSIFSSSYEAAYVFWKYIYLQFFPTEQQPTVDAQYLHLLTKEIYDEGDTKLATLIPQTIDGQKPKFFIFSIKSKFPCDYKTLQPVDICQLDCAGDPLGGKVYDRCGVCGGDETTCKITSQCPIRNCTICCGCDDRFKPIFPDKCGKCGGDGTSCLGCDNIPFSGKRKDFCGKCGGDNSTCLGCDGVVNSGKQKDLCGICDGGNQNRDVCGVCVTDEKKRGLSCAGCDGMPFSGKGIDACGVCGGTNLCKWRDGQLPEKAQGKTDAIVINVPLQ